MNIICPRCGFRMSPGEPPAGGVRYCPSCGGRVTSVASTEEQQTDRPAPVASDLDRWRQERRRNLIAVALLVIALLALMILFLLHPSALNSPARRLKNVVFGARITGVAEQFAGSGSGTGEGQGQQGEGAGQRQGRQSGSGDSGEREGGASGTTNPAAGNAPQGAEPRGRGHGTPVSEPLADAVNPQHPADNPPELPAPAARSIGWLDRFFGTQPQEASPIRAGEGGTGANPAASGNTNTASTPATNEPVAAEFTQSNPPASNVVSLTRPPDTRRATNRAPPPPTNTLNDNFEQLLRQHRAGSGDVRLSLMWSNRNDLDLHVEEPGGEEIYYQHRASHSGGLLDIDMNAGMPFRVPAVENVFWPQRAAPAGVYRILVNHYSQHDRENLTPFTVRVLIRGQTTDFNGAIRFGEPKKLIHQFTLAAPGR